MSLGDTSMEESSDGRAIESLESQLVGICIMADGWEACGDTSVSTVSGG